jgi:hypothetical protein
MSTFNVGATNTDRIKPYTELGIDMLQTSDKTPMITPTAGKQQRHIPNRTHQLLLQYRDQKLLNS